VLYNALFNLRLKKSGFSVKFLSGCHFFFRAKKLTIYPGYILEFKINAYLSINKLEEVGSDCKVEFLCKHQQKIKSGMHCALIIGLHDYRYI